MAIDKSNEFREEVLACIGLFENELAKRKRGISGESTITQIEGTILPELRRVAKEVGAGSLPSGQGRYLESFACAFRVWGWDMQNPTPLFLRLTELNDKYCEL